MNFKQLSFLSVDQDTTQTKSVHTIWKMHIDGAARNNPGPAGAGVCIFKESVPVVQKGFFLGTRTNNQAEYLSLLLGLYLVKPLLRLHDRIHIISDSQLLVRQIIGKYTVKDTHLRKLHGHAISWLTGLSFDIMHIDRSKNECADALANEGIDKKIPLPEEFIQKLSEL